MRDAPRLGFEYRHTAASRGWRDLTNGLLAEAAFRAGFRVILTRDRGFGESAAKALRSLPELAVVGLTVPQARAAVFVAEVEARWQARANRAGRGPCH